ncbi:MAG TPA: hypothetical protein VIM73_23245 [Polyangiaceae bacterium]
MTTTEQHPVKIEKFSRNLRTPLSDREIVERARRAAHLAAEIEQLEEEAKAAQKQAKARIEEIQAEQRRLNLEVADGAVHRETPCERRFIFRTGKVVEVRTDTEEELHERPMTERERQPELPGVDDSGPITPDEPGSRADDADDGIVDDDYVPEGSTEPELETEKPKKRGGRRKSGASAEAE